MSSGLPCTIAPLPARARVCGFVVLEGDTTAAALSGLAAVTGEFPKTEPLSMALRQTRYTWKQMSKEDKKQFKEYVERGISSVLPPTIDWQ